MNVQVTNQPIKKDKPFPKLMIAFKGQWENTICFFKTKNCGFLLGDTDSRIGYGTNFSMDDFTDFEGSITLSND